MAFRTPRMIQEESAHIEVLPLKSHVKTLFQTREHSRVWGVGTRICVWGPPGSPAPYPGVWGLAHQLSDSIRRRTAKTTE